MLMSVVAFAAITLILFLVAFSMFRTPPGTIGEYFNLGRTLKVMAFLYGTVFAPGVAVSVVYPFYFNRRCRGGKISYPLEIILIIVSAQTVFTFFLLQDI